MIENGSSRQGTSGRQCFFLITRFRLATFLASKNYLQGCQIQERLIYRRIKDLVSMRSVV